MIYDATVLYFIYTRRDDVRYFFFIDPPTTEIYTLSLHDALPISRTAAALRPPRLPRRRHTSRLPPPRQPAGADRKSTRLNSSHANISYAVFCLKKKTKDQDKAET